MFCDQADTYCWGEGRERGWGRVWNNLIRRQHVEQCRSEGRNGTLNLERDCEIVRPRPTFPSRVVLHGGGDGGREREIEREREMRSEWEKRVSAGEWGSAERRVWIKARCRGMCDMNVIQCGLSKSHRAGAWLNLPTYMFLLYTHAHIHSHTLCFDVPPRHTYMQISSLNPLSLTYKQAAKPTQFIPSTQTAQYALKQ